jgi:hypothetical protein
MAMSVAMEEWDGLLEPTKPSVLVVVVVVVVVVSIPRVLSMAVALVSIPRVLL